MAKSHNLEAGGERGIEKVEDLQFQGKDVCE